jgi:hypothetical protein
MLLPVTAVLLDQPQMYVDLFNPESVRAVAQATQELTYFRAVLERAQRNLRRMAGKVRDSIGIADALMESEGSKPQGAALRLLTSEPSAAWASP